MNKKLLFIIIGLTFLVTVRFFGTPFEFLNVTADTIATFIIVLLFLLLIFLLFRQIRRLDNKILKSTMLGLLILLAIPYLFGSWATSLTALNYHPMWQDLTVYTNSKGQKVISQWREKSSSNYDYSDRKIIADFGQLRISFDCNAKNLNGIWTKYDIKKNITTTINFDDNK